MVDKFRLRPHNLKGDTMEQKYDYLVLIGRFQIFHNAHQALLKEALARAHKVIVVLGSANKPRMPKNPFLASEREAMIRAAMGTEVDRLIFLPIRDYYNNEKWARAVSAAVEARVEKGSLVKIIGHNKDETTAYLQMFPQWGEAFEVRNYYNINATDLRRLYFQVDNQTANMVLLSTRVPATVFDILSAFTHLGDYETLQKGFKQREDYRKAWASAPFPPIFVTVDAVVTCRDHVLMIQRARFPGEGQWALPGGFLNEHEPLRDGVLRELKEETGLSFTNAYLNSLVKDSEVFDYPGRSERGRTITHAYHIELGPMGFPQVAGQDDAKDARWIPISDLAGMEDQIFEDHLAIIDRFVSIFSSHHLESDGA